MCVYGIDEEQTDHYVQPVSLCLCLPRGLMSRPVSSYAIMHSHTQKDRRRHMSQWWSAVAFSCENKHLAKTFWTRRVWAMTSRDPHHVKKQHESISESLRDLFKNMKAFCLFLYNWRPPACMHDHTGTEDLCNAHSSSTLSKGILNKQTPTNTHTHTHRHTHTHTDVCTSAHLPPNTLTSYSERGQSSRDPKHGQKKAYC